MYTIGTGGVILIIALLIFGYILGFAAGIAYTLRKIRSNCDYDVYRNVMTRLHADANKED